MPFHHLIILDKPPGLSSAAAVSRVKHCSRAGTKIGHAGTLDPFATGVLLLLIGTATKRCESLMDQPKQYEATIKLGSTTATDDPESPEQPFISLRSLGVPPAHVAAPLAVGEMPRHVGANRRPAPEHSSARSSSSPPRSARLKVKGRRAYDLARRGEPVQLAPRTVHVYAIELLHYDWPLLQLRIDCGRGTYIRPSPATSAPPSTSAATSPISAARASAPTPSPVPPRSTSSTTTASPPTSARSPERRPRSPSRVPSQITDQH